MFPNMSLKETTSLPSSPYSPSLHLAFHSIVIYLLVCLSHPLAWEPHEGSDTVLFTDMSPVPGTVPGTQ